MKSHEFARLLLNAPDVPLLINGWGSDEGCGRVHHAFEVHSAILCSYDDGDFIELHPEIEKEWDAWLSERGRKVLRGEKKDE